MVFVEHGISVHPPLLLIILYPAASLHKEVSAHDFLETPQGVNVATKRELGTLCILGMTLGDWIAASCWAPLQTPPLP